MYLSPSFNVCINLYIDATDADKTGETGICNATGLMAEKPYKTTRPWTPLEVRNEAYEEKLKIRLEGADQKDFLSENIVSLLRTKFALAMKLTFLLLPDVSARYHDVHVC